MSVKGAGRLQGCGPVNKLFSKTLAVIAAATLLSCSSHEPVKTAKTQIAPETQAATGNEPPRRLRLLTATQLQNTMAYVFGSGIAVPSSFATVSRDDGLLGVGTSFAGVTSSQIETYQKTAATVDALIMSERYRNFLMPCQPKDEKAADDACAQIGRAHV